MKEIKDVIVFGHRGASKIAPENTLLSFQKAIELRADYIELDLHISRDSCLVVIHDKNTYRTTGIKGKVKNMTYEHLKQLDAGEGEKIPLLKEVINLARGKIKFLIEIKAPGLAPFIVKSLKAANLIESTIVSSFNYNELLNIHQLEPRLKLALLVLGLRKKKVIRRLSEHGFYAVQSYYKLVSQKFVTFAHKNDIKVHVWTVDSKSAIQKLISIGVDGVITNDIQLALNIIKKK
ncbi:MAG: glycerophosphodiester phosphodiesterase [Promethearchaeota archaeon]